MASADDAFQASFSCPSGCYSRCPGGSCDYDTTGEGDYYRCNCGSQATTEEECGAIDHNDYSFVWYTETCAEKINEWSYDDAATQCSDDPWDLNEYAASCCSDGLSVCMDYASQLCQDESAFLPTAIAESSCSTYYGSSSVNDAFKASFSCPSGCYSACPGGSCYYDTTAVGDYWACYCDSLVTTEA